MADGERDRDMLAESVCDVRGKNHGLYTDGAQSDAASDAATAPPTLATVFKNMRRTNTAISTYKRSWGKKLSWHLCAHMPDSVGVGATVAPRHVPTRVARVAKSHACRYIEAMQCDDDDSDHYATDDEFEAGCFEDTIQVSRCMHALLLCMWIAEVHHDGLLIALLHMF